MDATTTHGDPLAAGRAAVARRAWPEAYDALSAADRTSDLEPEDLELLGKASWWAGDQNGSIDARERAYAKYLDRGDKQHAAFTALTLRRQYTTKLARSIAQGWLNRAERLLEDEPESLAHGYLALAHGSLAWGRGELEHALSHFDRGVEISGRIDDGDLRAWATMYRGMVLVDLGRVEEGWALLEDVSAAAVGGELGAHTTGAVFCNVISTCRDLADYRRASEWAEAATRWCERQAINGFPGVCRVHRAEIMRLLGTWAEAETELRRACDELTEFSPIHAGAAFHELGEVRLRMGDLPGAEEAFRQAHEMGEDPQPGRAMLLLAEGKTDGASASIRRSLEDETSSRLNRARLLPAQAEIARVAGDVATASAAAQELDEIAADYDADAIRAAAEWANALADLAGGDAGAASKRLRRARQLWRKVEAPYEAAKASVTLADALTEDGDPEGAILELEAARSAFARLGAAPDERLAAERLRTLRRSPGAVTRRTFVFTDIVGSTSLLEAIGDDAWENLRRWHDETLRACFAEHGGQEVDHAGDGFFVAFPDSTSALACVLHVQRRLAEHRTTAGFAPQVRIGLHAGEAMDAGGDYIGRGVHLAARIGAIGGAGEIVASAATVEDLDAEVTDRRTVELKGIAAPVEVVSIVWR
jgi:class 3 adenylate cyclase